MRVAFLTDEVLPSHGADTMQFVHALSALVRTGVEVDLYFPVAPGAPTHTTAMEDLRERLRSHYAAECGFQLRPVPGALGGHRVLTKVAAGTLACAAALRAPSDLVHTRTLLPSLASLAARRPLFFETYRPLTEQFPATRPFFRALTPLRPFAGIVVHSALTRDRFIQDGVPREKVITLYNGFDAALLGRETPAPEARALLGWPERPTAVYAGRVGRIKAVDLFVEAAKQTPDVDWVMIGHLETDDAREIQAQAAGLPNVRFAGFLSGEQLHLAHQAADVLLVPPSRRPLSEAGTTVMPLKLFGYLAANRAVLAGELPDTTELLRHGENAWLVPPDDVPALALAVRRLMADADLRRGLAAAARALAESLTWDARARRLRAFYEARLAA